MENHKLWHIIFHGIGGVQYYLNDYNPNVKDLTVDFRFPPLFGDKVLNPFLYPVPPVPVTKEEMRSYLSYIFEYAELVLKNVDEETLMAPSRFIAMNMSRTGILFYAIRHMMSYTGQAITYLRQNGNVKISWQ